MLLNKYQFRFSFLYTFMSIIGITVFVTLGTWQSFRAMEKQSLQEEIDYQHSQPAFLLNDVLDDLLSKKYLRVEAIGHFDKANELLIDNTVYNGMAGYYVMTPFILKDENKVIMVNRGWVPVGNDRNILPEIDTPEKVIHIHGVISPPKSKPPLILAELDSSEKVWLYYDEEKYSTDIHNNLLMSVIILQDQADQYGYVREWPKYDTKVGMHIGYAIQWHAFALIVLVTYIFLNFKKRDKQQSESDK